MYSEPKSRLGHLSRDYGDWQEDLYQGCYQDREEVVVGVRT